MDGDNIETMCDKCFKEVNRFKLGDSLRLTLNQLSNLARQRFLQEYSELDGRHKDFARMEMRFNNPYYTGEELIAEKLTEASRRGVIRNLQEFSGFVRELQAFANHAVYQVDGDYISRFVFFILESKDFKRERQPRDIVAYLNLCFETHRSVDAFLARENKAVDEAYEKIEAVFEKFSTSRKTLRDISLENRRAREWKNFRSTAHHALDWYMMASGRSAHSKSPTMLAALGIGIIERIHGIVTGRASPFTLRKLAEFGGWKGGASSFSGAVYRPFYDVIYAAKDIPLLFFDDGPEPDNWFKRLVEVAPALKEWSNNEEFG